LLLIILGFIDFFTQYLLTFGMFQKKSAAESSLNSRFLSQLCNRFDYSFWPTLWLSLFLKQITMFNLCNIPLCTTFETKHNSFFPLPKLNSNFESLFNLLIEWYHFNPFLISWFHFNPFLISWFHFIKWHRIWYSYIDY
jgi:hypothetical protein